MVPMMRNLIRFDTFFASFVQCFFVSTGEHWTDIMYYTMAHFGARASTFFVALVVFTSKLVLVYLTQAALLASVLPGNSNAKTVGAYVIQVIYEKHTIRIGFKRFRWNTAVGMVERIAFTPWCRAAQNLGGATRLVNFVQVIGLKGESLREVRHPLLHFENADVNADWEDTKLEAMERAKLQIPIPVSPEEIKAGDVNGTKALSAGEDMHASDARDKSYHSNAPFVPSPANSAQPAKVIESRNDWISQQAKIARLVGQFAYEHVPLGFDVVRDKKIGDFFIVNKATRVREPLSKFARKAAAEIAEATVTHNANGTSTQTLNPNSNASRSVFDTLLQQNQEFSEPEDEYDIVNAHNKGPQYSVSTQNSHWLQIQQFSKALVSGILGNVLSYV